MLLNHGVTCSLAMDTRNIHQITIYIFVFLCRYIHSLHLPCKFLTEGLPTHQTPYLRPHSFRIYILLGFCFVCACLSQFISWVPCFTISAAIKRSLVAISIIFSPFFSTNSSYSCLRFRSSSKHVWMHIYTHSHIHTYIHTYIHTLCTCLVFIVLLLCRLDLLIDFRNFIFHALKLLLLLLRTHSIDLWKLCKKKTTQSIHFKKRRKGKERKIKKEIWLQYDYRWGHFESPKAPFFHDRLWFFPFAGFPAHTSMDT